MANPRSFDARDQVPAADSTDNLQFSDVIGNKTDAAAAPSGTTSIVAGIKYIAAAVGAGGQIVWDKSAASSFDEDGGRYSFDVGVVDRDTGAVSSANINIASAVVTLEKSTAGGAFSTAGVTQPTAAKANGLVTVSADVTASEWAVGDSYKLTLTTVSATNSASTVEYMPAMVWVGQVTEDSDVKTTVDDIDTDLGEPGDAASTTGAVHPKLNAIRDALGIVASGAGGGYEADGAPSLYDRVTGDADSIENRLGNPTGDTLSTITAKLGDNDDAATDPSAASGNVLSKLRGVGDNLDTAIDYVTIPTANSVNNDNVADAVGNKTDTAVGAAGTTTSLMAYQKHMVDAIGADNANNAFASTNVAANRDGSLMERAEDIRVELGASGDAASESGSSHAKLSAILADTDKLTDTAIDGTETTNSLYDRVFDMWRREARTAFNNATLGTTETDMLAVGAVGTDVGRRLEGAVVNIAALGTGTTTVKFRIYVEINGVETLVSTVDRTVTGGFNLAYLAGSPYASRRLRITVQRNEGSGTDGSVSASMETSVAGV